ncbi:MAG: hypothetical protein L0Z46_06785 [Nitrospiraceae bacterium]|nr:hypothetical protein [Nitrospiraceae bacterium]
MTSESTWFFEQPRLTKPMVVFLLFGRDGVINRDDIGAVYGTAEKPVNQQPLEVVGQFPYSGRMIHTFQGIKPTIPTSCFIEEHCGV